MLNKLKQILFMAILGVELYTNVEEMHVSPSGVHSIGINPDEYLRDRVQKAQEVIEKFDKHIAVLGKRGDKQVFYQILYKVAINDVGYYVLNRICDTIEQVITKQKEDDKEEEDDKRFLLTIKIDNNNQGFSPNINVFSGKITFATHFIPINVVNRDLKITIMEDTPADVLLFYEILHFARFLINKDRFLDEGSQKSSLKPLVITHKIFCDFPNLTDNFNKEVMKAKIAIEEGKLTAGSFVDDISLPWSILTLKGRMFMPVPADFIIGNLQETAKKISIPVIDVEEVRNIVGEGKHSIDPIDKICENSYRIAYNEMKSCVSTSMVADFTSKLGVPSEYRASFSDLFIRADLGLRYGHLVAETNFPVFASVFEWVHARAVDGLQKVKNANKSILFLGCLSIAMPLFAMHYCAPSNEDLNRLGEMQAVISIDESKEPSAASEWMKRAVMYQARAYIADSMSLPQSYDGIEACRCCREVKKLDRQFVKHFNHLDQVATVIKEYFMKQEKFKAYAISALNNIAEEQSELQKMKSHE